MKTVSILIPVLNEASTLREILERVWGAELPRGLAREVIIVDNGSTDGSLAIAKTFAKRRARRVRVLRCEKKGKGNAVRLGLQHASGEILLIQDADLEYDVRDYARLLQPIVDGRTRVVLGSRHLHSASWQIRHFPDNPLGAMVFNLGGVFFHGLFNFCYGVHLTDPTTMYKVFSREALQGLSFSAGRFDFDCELLAKLIRSGNPPLEVPVSYRARGFAEGKKIRVLQDPAEWLWAILKFRFSPLGATAG